MAEALTHEQYEAALRNLRERWPTEPAARQAAADLLTHISAQLGRPALLEIVGVRAPFWAAETGAPAEQVIVDNQRLVASGMGACEFARYLSSGYDDGAVDFGPDVGGSTYVREVATGVVFARYRDGSPVADEEVTP